MLKMSVAQQRVPQCPRELVEVYADGGVVALSNPINIGLVHCRQARVGLHNPDDRFRVLGVDATATSGSLLHRIEDFPPQPVWEVQERAIRELLGLSACVANEIVKFGSHLARVSWVC